MNYSVFEYNNLTNEVGNNIRVVDDFSKLLLKENEVAFISDIERIPDITLTTIEMWYKIKIPLETKIKVYMKSDNRKYVYFKLDNVCYMYILLERLQKVPKSKAYYQIKRLQNELLSMMTSAGYSSDYLERKFKDEYDNIMVINHGDNNE